MQHALGTVTEMEARQDAQGDISYFPHVRFRLPDDRIVQIVAANGVSSSAFNDRENVRVAYPAGDPENAVIAPTTYVYKAAIGFGIAGTVLFDLGALLWAKRRQRQMLRRI